MRKAGARTATAAGQYNRRSRLSPASFVLIELLVVGLKQLWTFRWHRYFDPNGPWTKAGGVEPSDWPQWMRRLRDY